MVQILSLQKTLSWKRLLFERSQIRAGWVMLFLTAFLLWLPVTPPLMAASNKIGTAQICLAGLIHQYNWLDENKAPRKGMGRYSHSTDDIHVFKTRVGSLLCRVQQNRVMVADARGRWQNGPEDDFFSFEVGADTLTIHRRGSNGHFDRLEMAHAEILSLLPASKSCIPVNPHK